MSQIETGPLACYNWKQRMTLNGLDIPDTNYILERPKCFAGAMCFRSVAK